MTYDKNNIFAKILRGELPCTKVYEDEFALAFHDIHPDAPVHVLVVPKQEFISFNDFAEKADPAFMQGFWKAVRETSNLLKLAESGYRLVANHGPDAMQAVPHFHVHILGGRKLGKLLPEG